MLYTAPPRTASKDLEAFHAMAMDHDTATRALDAIADPLLGGRGLVEAGLVDALTVDGQRCELVLAIPFAAAGWHEDLRRQVEQALRQAGASELSVTIRTEVHASPVPSGLDPLPGVRNIVAVASGKGGVGKSTVAANLALALQAEGARVGVLDADIYGPSQPRMLGVTDARPQTTADRRLVPVQAHGLQVMSIGFLVDEQTPTIWRGPMVTQALHQLVSGTNWQDLDYLVIDLPPGTGDVQLSLAQRVPVSGAVIVTTPQDIALVDARKGLRMFGRVGVPVLGIVENMASFVCPCCGHEEAIFGSGGGQRLAEESGTELLGSLPLDRRIREQADGGAPTVVAEPDGVLAQRYREIARRAAARLALSGPQDAPEITVDED